MKRKSQSARRNSGRNGASPFKSGTTFKRLVSAMSLLVLAGISAPALEAQSAASQTRTDPPPSEVAEELRALRDEVRALRQEVKGLREELHSREPQLPQVASTSPVEGLGLDRPRKANSDQHHIVPQLAPRPTLASAASVASASNVSPAAAPQEPIGATQTESAPEAPLADRVSMLESQVAEHAQTKVESYSKVPVKIFGTILSTTFYNSHAPDWADVPSVVNYAWDVPSSTGSFSSSLRQSRLGVMVDGPALGSWKASGYFAVDFLGGMTDFQSTPVFGLPHIVYGYARFESPRTALEFGQDELLLAPGNPTSLAAFSFPLLFRSGNLYARAPQVRVEQSLVDSSQGTLRLALGLVAPVGSYPGLDFPGSNLSEAWQRPAVQGRLTWRSNQERKRGWMTCLSGHYGRVRLGTFAAPSWAGAFDFDAHVQHFGLDAEGYLGQNLQSFGGGMGQPGRTLGGYAEGRIQATRRLKFDGGFGTDHLYKFDLIPVDLNRNTSFFGNTIFQFTPEVAASFEYRHLVTRPFVGGLRPNDHVDLAIAYSF